jgi:cell division protein FtsB
VNPTIHSILTSQFTWGLVLGLIFAVLALYRIVRLKSEIKRYKRHLSDRMEIEAESVQKKTSELDRLKKENENLRVKVASLNDFPEHRLERDLEIYARAEKRMVVGVPGFAGPWENAKHDALVEIQGEEAGQSLPKRVFARLFPSLRDEKAALSDASSANAQQP